MPAPKIDYRLLRKAFVNAIKQKTRNRFKISLEPKIDNFFNPDLVLSDGLNKIFLELKSSTYPQRNIDALYQIIGYDRISPDLFNEFVLIIPKTSLNSKLKDLISKVQRELANIHVLTYHIKNDKILFEQLAAPSLFLPINLSSDLPSSVSTSSRKKRISLSYPKSMRVVRYLLETKKTTQKEIAEKTNVSVGLVNKIATYLIDNGIAHYKRRDLILSEPWKLLNEIAWSRKMEQLRIAKYSLPDTFLKTEDAEKKIADLFSSNDTRYAFTLFSAASRYTSYMKKNDVVQLYAEHLNSSLQTVLAQEFNTDSRGGVYLEIFEPDSIDIFTTKERINGFSVCSKIQTVIDLYCFGNIGRDLAIDLYSKIKSEQY